MSLCHNSRILTQFYSDAYLCERTPVHYYIYNNTKMCLGVCTELDIILRILVLLHCLSLLFGFYSMLKHKQVIVPRQDTHKSKSIG